MYLIVFIKINFGLQEKILLRLYSLVYALMLTHGLIRGEIKHKKRIGEHESCPEFHKVPVDPPAPHRWQKGNNRDFFFADLMPDRVASPAINPGYACRECNQKEKKEKFNTYYLCTTIDPPPSVVTGAASSVAPF
jgi:hypothetical protein